MSLDAVYQDRLLDLAADIAREGHVVARPTASGSAYSRACGSRIRVEVELDGDRVADYGQHVDACARSEEHTSELQSLMRISYAVFCLKNKNVKNGTHSRNRQPET